MHVQALRSVCGKVYVYITHIFSDGTKDLQNVVNRLRVFVKLKGQLENTLALKTVIAACE